MRSRRRQVDDRAEMVEGALIDAMRVIQGILDAVKARHRQRRLDLEVCWKRDDSRTWIELGERKLLFVRVGPEIHVSEDGVPDARRIKFDYNIGGCWWFISDTAVGSVPEVANDIVGMWEKARFAQTAP